jgi:hypothetical protein
MATGKYRRSECFRIFANAIGNFNRGGPPVTRRGFTDVEQQHLAGLFCSEPLPAFETIICRCFAS